MGCGKDRVAPQLSWCWSRRNVISRDWLTVASRAVDTLQCVACMYVEPMLSLRTSSGDHLSRVTAWSFLFVSYLMVLFQIIGDIFRNPMSGWLKAV